jgi:hypothetical protein
MRAEPAESWYPVTQTTKTHPVERLEALVKQLPDIESTIESNPSLRDLLNSVGKGVPLVEELKNPPTCTLAPWAGLFIGEDRNIGIALNYGFVLGLRFAYEEQKREAAAKEAAA